MPAGVWEGGGGGMVLSIWKEEKVERLFFAQGISGFLWVNKNSLFSSFEVTSLQILAEVIFFPREAKTRFAFLHAP